MQLLLSEEQKMIRDSAGTLMERVAGAKTVSVWSVFDSRDE